MAISEAVRLCHSQAWACLEQAMLGIVEQYYPRLGRPRRSPTTITPEYWQKHRVLRYLKSLGEQAFSDYNALKQELSLKKSCSIRGYNNAGGLGRNTSYRKPCKTGGSNLTGCPKPSKAVTLEGTRESHSEGGRWRAAYGNRGSGGHAGLFFTCIL